MSLYIPRSLEQSNMKALRKLIQKKTGTKKPGMGLASLAALMNPGAQRQRELNNIRKAALQRTLAKLEKNIKRREKGLPPIKEKQMPQISTKGFNLSKLGFGKKKKKEDSDEEYDSDEFDSVDSSEEVARVKPKKKKEPKQPSAPKKEDESTGQEGDKKGDGGDGKDSEGQDDKGEGEEGKLEGKEEKTEGKEESPEDDEDKEEKKPPRKTAKQLRLEEEARIKAEIEARKREEMEALRAKWPVLKGTKAVKDATPCGSLEKERWKAFVADQKGVIDTEPNDYWAHYNLGVAYQAREEFGKAMSHYQAALFARPSDMEVRKKVGDLILQRDTRTKLMGGKQTDDRVKLEPVDPAAVSTAKKKTVTSLFGKKKSAGGGMMGLLNAAKTQQKGEEEMGKEEKEEEKKGEEEKEEEKKDEADLTASLPDTPEIEPATKQLLVFQSSLNASNSEKKPLVFPGKRKEAPKLMPLTDSRSQYEEIIESGQGPVAAAHYELGIQAQNVHDDETAIKHYRAALERDPALHEARANLGICLFQKATGDYRDYSIEHMLAGTGVFHPENPPPQDEELLEEVRHHYEVLGMAGFPIPADIEFVLRREVLKQRQREAAEKVQREIARKVKERSRVKR